MIITKTPLRISFVGGGTDQPAYFAKRVGRVISTTIDKYVYVTVNHKFDGRVSLRYSETENVAHADKLQHTIVRECLKEIGIEDSIEIVTISDVPMDGTGLGSSSALTVGLLKALGRYVGKEWRPEELARTAYKIEAEILCAPIGLQDQYAAVFGGFNHFIFGRTSIGTEDLYEGRSILLDDCTVSQTKILWLEENTMLFYLGRARNTNPILREQVENMEANLPIYDAIGMFSLRFLQWLASDSPYDMAGEIIARSWESKKQLGGGVTDADIDRWYTLALGKGAIGGKVVGAGGGGFLMLIVPGVRRGDVRQELDPLVEMPFRFSRRGSEVIYDGR